MERNESVRSSKGVALINEDLETPDMNFEYSVVVKEMPVAIVVWICRAYPYPIEFLSWHAGIRVAVQSEKSVGSAEGSSGPGLSS